MKLRQYIFILFFSLVLMACGGSDPDSGTQEPEPTTGNETPAPTPTPDPTDSNELQAGFTAPFNKIFRQEPVNFQGTISDSVTIYMAKNEYEATQVVLFPATHLANVTVTLDNLQSETGSGMIPASDVEINVVGYINLVTPTVVGSRTGWHPDPLLPNHAVNLEQNIPQAYLVTVQSRDTTAADTYRGTLSISRDGDVIKQLELRVVVWNFTLPRSSQFKTVSLANWDKAGQAWPPALGYSWPSQEEMKRRYLQLADLGFKNRLPPVAYIANGLSSWNWQGEGGTSYGYPTHDELQNGSKLFNAQRTDELIDYMLAKGANHFFIALTSDIYLNPATAAQREDALKQYLSDYTAHLRSRNLLDMAYVYGTDEPWGEAVQHAKDTYTLVKNQVAADIKFIQNTNQNNGTVIGEFMGFFDALDINLGFYDITNSESYRLQNPTQMSDFWWNVNIWPQTHPNLFVEYPLSDARIIGPLSFKYNMQGFEYWDLLSFTGIDNYRPISTSSVLTGWTVRDTSLDGTVVYPGEDFRFYSSLRLESFRDGMEDQEYLYLLRRVDPGNALLSVPIISGLTTYDSDQDGIMSYRNQIGELLHQANIQ